MAAEVRGNRLELDNEVPSEISEHVSWLEQVTAEALAQVKILSAEVDCVEKCIRSFLNEYYSEVGEYFGDLEQVKRRIEQIQIEANGDLDKMEDKVLTKFADNYSEGEEVCEVYVQRRAINEEEAKYLFRKLAKRCHPDTSELPNAREIFAEASRAYQDGDLCNLILLEQSMVESRYFSRETQIQKLERFEGKYQMALREKDLLMRKKNKLKFSPSFQLWQSVFREKAKGHDLVREIKHNVMQELSDKKKILKEKQEQKHFATV